jgi:restriction endonuclease Mrr
MHRLRTVRSASGEKRQMHSVESITHSGIAPFESYFSGQLLDEREPLHPHNASPSDFQPVIRELDRVVGSLISTPDRILKVRPSSLEKIIAEVYRAHGLEVRVTGGPKDHGVDAEAIAYVPMKLPRKFSQHLRIAIQVKRYKKSRKVRERELRDLYGSLVADGYDRGVLVTTSSLTAAASHYLETRCAVKDRIRVVAGDEVLELLLSYCKQRWIPFWH